MSQARIQQHTDAHATRVARLQRGVYGAVQAPVLPRGRIVLHDLPSYTESHWVVRSWSQHKTLEGVPARCFYTGVPLTLATVLDRDPRRAPWLPTRDHLVPLRRQVPGMPAVGPQHATAQVLSANVVNVTLGLAPLLVRLKIRSWLRTVPFDPDDLSTDAGNNLRWVVIDMINDFRILGRLPWSRDAHGQWWDPEISRPFMARMHAAESAFLDLDLHARQAFIETHRWTF